MLWSWGCVVLCRGQWRVVSVFRRPRRRGSGVGRSSGTPLVAWQVSGPGTNTRPRLGALVRRPWAPQWGTPGRPKDPVRGLGSPPPPTQEVPQVSNRIWDQGLIRVWEYSGKDIRSIGQTFENGFTGLLTLLVKAYFCDVMVKSWCQRPLFLSVSPLNIPFLISDDSYISLDNIETIFCTFIFFYFIKTEKYYYNNLNVNLKDGQKDRERHIILETIKKILIFINYCQVLERNFLKTGSSCMGDWGRKVLSSGWTNFSHLIFGTSLTDRTLLINVNDFMKHISLSNFHMFFPYHAANLSLLITSLLSMSICWLASIAFMEYASIAFMEYFSVLKLICLCVLKITQTSKSPSDCESNQLCDLLIFTRRRESSHNF